MVALPNRPAKEASDDVVRDCPLNLDDYMTELVQNYYCAFIGSFGEYACNPRTLSSTHLNHMVSLEGIVTKCSLVRPKVIKSVHYNETKNIFHFREYRDQTMTATGAASTSVYPTEDEEGNPVSLLNYLIQTCLLELICEDAANHRVWILYVSRPSNHIHTGDA